MTPQAIRALELRKLLAKSSTAKLATLAEKTGPGDRLRYQYTYYGAHTGRWSGRGQEASGVQLQNLTRGTLKPEDVELCVEAIRTGYGAIGAYGNTLDVVSSCMRGAFRAPAGCRFVVCDLSQIEIRVLAWLTECPPLLDAFARKADIYTEFASEHLYNVPADAVTKKQRQIAKSAVLGCGYQLGGGAEVWDCCSAPAGGEHRPFCTADIDPDTGAALCDVAKSGLWGYAEAMGVEMSQAEAAQAVRVFRDAYIEVKHFWSNVEHACIHAVENPSVAVPGHHLEIRCVPNKLLYITLPSGRRLHYLRPRIAQGTWPSGEPKTSLTYEAKSDTGQWKRRPTYGGHITENLCQAIARDVLAESMLRADEAGYSIVGHTHDEIICCERTESSNNLEHLRSIMIQTPAWASDLVLDADGYESEVYRK